MSNTSHRFKVFIQQSLSNLFVVSFKKFLNSVPGHSITNPPQSTLLATHLFEVVQKRHRLVFGICNCQSHLQCNLPSVWCSKADLFIFRPQIINTFFPLFPLLSFTGVDYSATYKYTFGIENACSHSMFPYSGLLFFSSATMFVCQLMQSMGCLPIF